MSEPDQPGHRPLDVACCDTLLSTTRSVRRALDLERPVPPEVIEECLKLAVQAPNGANRQDWHWLVITGAEQRSRVAEIYRRAFYARNGAEPRPGLPQQASVLAESMHRVPVLVLPCLELGRALPTGNQAGVWTSLLPAAWSYALAARSRGLGTTLTTCHLDLEIEMANLLGLPEHVYQGPLIPTAYTTRRDFGPGRRLRLEDVVHVDGWQQRTAAADATTKTAGAAR